MSRLCRLALVFLLPLPSLVGAGCDGRSGGDPGDVAETPDGGDASDPGPDTAPHAPPDSIQGCDELPGDLALEVSLLDDWSGLDPTGVSGAVDGEGRARFVYSRDGALRLGRWTGDATPGAQLEIVPLGVSGFTFGSPRLALDSADRPHLLYGRGDGDVIEYRAAHPDDAGGFDHVVVDPDVGGAMVIGPALAAAGDQLIAAWRADGASPLGWATRRPPEPWAVEALGEDVVAPVGPAVARTPDGADHLVFFDATSGRTLHAHRAAGAAEWIFDVLATPPSTGFARRAALALGPDGALHAVHFDQGLRVDVLRDGDWTELTRTADGELLNPAIAVDPCGVLFVAYTDIDALEVRLLYGRPDVGWTTLTVAPLVTEVNTPITLGLAPDQRAFILWYEPDREGPTGEGHNQIWGAVATPTAAPPPR